MLNLQGYICKEWQFDETDLGDKWLRVKEEVLPVLHKTYCPHGTRSHTASVNTILFFIIILKISCIQIILNGSCWF